jgi:hypothetical protein
MRKLRFNKKGDIVIREYHLIPRVRVRHENIFIDDDNICDDCNYKYNCPITRVVNKISKCF